MQTSIETLRKMESIFHDALEAAADERAALIELRCAGDEELAAEVYSLLRAGDEERSATATLEKEREAAPGQEAGLERIGAYAIDRLIGRGGMGAVYLAHRDDGQFTQQVAIKLIDLPLATAQFRERFLQERQILANLRHPAIARLLDGGVSSTGDPYLVMEYIDGLPIHTYCERNEIGLAGRVRLFLSVLEAVQFAHLNLIVHRDLKPDNILVTSDGLPHLLDFGTAKMLSSAEGARPSERTRVGFASYTPQYASPEQVLGQPITTASDTYSLGVLLYRLLTGGLPYEFTEFTMAELLRVVCEEPPRKAVVAAAPGRGHDLDLEAILGKALRKSPLERYATVEQMSSDLTAWLDGRPVAARQGNWRYRAGKFARLHWVGLAVALVLALSILGGVAGVLWQASVANRERRIADARSADLRQLSNSLLSELDEAIQELPGSIGAQKLLVTRVLEHLDRMARDAHGDLQTQLDLVAAYTRMGNLQGNSYDQNLGDPEGGLKGIDAALRIARPLAAAYPSNRDVLHALALALQSRGEILWETARTAEAVPLQREAVRSFEQLSSSPSATLTEVLDTAGAWGTLGDELGQDGTASLSDPAAAIDAYRHDFPLYERALRLDANSTRARRGVLITHLKIGSAEMYSDPGAALAEFDSALAVRTGDGTTPGLSDLRLRANILRKQGIASSETGDEARATRAFGDAENLYRSIAARDTNDTRAQIDLAIQLQDEADSAESAADSDLAHRHALLALEEKKLLEIVSICDHIADLRKIEEWAVLSANSQVRAGVVDHDLNGVNHSVAATRQALITLRGIAAAPHASGATLTETSDAFRIAQPASLRDILFSVECARRADNLAQGKSAARDLTLALAYRSAGQIDAARSTARHGLSLLAPPRPGGKISTLQSQLEAQLR